uniref:Uncharacterized protein LOC111137631 isoform X4 n=1 Tax=Crassostrea virginica TaxID=6565 RepID=A0A8B8EY22_CRAVI|nr:uncharacterized protein LOC111137631 isoform X4 [Crassostrea virginica]
MAETEIVVRPFKMIGEVFTGVAGVFLIITAVGQDWVEVQFFRTSHVITWGLWDICVGGVCLPDSGWLEICRGMLLLAVLLSLTAFVCGVVGLCVHSHCSKRVWFLLAGALLSLVGDHYVFWMSSISIPISISIHRDLPAHKGQSH